MRNIGVDTGINIVPVQCYAHTSAIISRSFEELVAVWRWSEPLSRKLDIRASITNIARIGKSNNIGASEV
jgi:hypothetical protein